MAGEGEIRRPEGWRMEKKRSATIASNFRD
jgi:hypothetical protein